MVLGDPGGRTAHAQKRAEPARRLEPGPVITRLLLAMVPRAQDLLVRTRTVTLSHVQVRTKSYFVKYAVLFPH